MNRKIHPFCRLNVYITIKNIHLLKSKSESEVIIMAVNKFLPQTGARAVKEVYDRLPSDDFIVPDHQELLMREYRTRDEVREALKKEREHGRDELVYKQMSPELKRDREFMQELLRDDPRVWRYMSPELRDSLDMKFACLQSHNRHMQPMEIDGQTRPMYSSQLPSDVINDPRVMVPAYTQAYQANLQQNVDDRFLTLEMVARAKGNPEMQQELNQAETNVIMKNKDEIARVATQDPRVMEAVQARAPEAQKEIEAKRQAIEMAHLREDERLRASQDGDNLESHTMEYRVGATAPSHDAAYSALVAGSNAAEQGQEQVIQEQYDGWDPTGKSNEEKYIEFKEARGDYADYDGDGIRNDQDLEDYTPYSPFSSPELLEAKDPADIFDNPWD